MYSTNFGELTYVIKVPSLHVDPANVCREDLLFGWFLSEALAL